MKNILIGVLIFAIVLMFALYFPASAHWNEKSGNLKLSARFKGAEFPLKKYMGKKEEIKEGKTSFFVDYTTKNIVKWRITHAGSVLIQGQGKYKLGDVIQNAIPSHIAQYNTQPGTNQARTSCNGSCNH